MPMTLAVKKKYNIIVLSPHLDDAVLSLSDHISNWKKQGKLVKIITIFTCFGDSLDLPRYTRDYINKSGFKNIKLFQKKRIEEDIQAMKMLDVEWEHWGFVDAGFRKLYNTRSALLGGKIHYKDDIIIHEISKKMLSIDADKVYLPFGIGGHVDHLLVKKSGKVLFKNIEYYLELPYLWQSWRFLKYIYLIFSIKSVELNSKNKYELIKQYTSQYKLLLDYCNSWVEITI